MSEIDRLRAQVLDRYVSVHAFCRAHPELKRATVYLVLSGRYPGQTSTQAAKIKAALSTPAEVKQTVPVLSITEKSVAEMLQNIRCAHCRRLDRRECLACRNQTEREGKELFDKLCQEYEG